MNARIQELAEQCYQIEDPHGRFPREVLNPGRLCAQHQSTHCFTVAVVDRDVGGVDRLRQISAEIGLSL